MIRGFSGGKHAAKRPIETSAVVHKVGGVEKLLLLPLEGSKETVPYQCSPLSKKVLTAKWRICYVGEHTSKQLCDII